MGMKTVQRLFLGDLPVTTLVTALNGGSPALDDLLQQTADADSKNAPSPQDIFYLWFYLGLFHEMEGRPTVAHSAITKALGGEYEGDDYMVCVAKVHVKCQGS